MSTTVRRRSVAAAEVIMKPLAYSVAPAAAAAVARSASLWQRAVALVLFLWSQKVLFALLFVVLGCASSVGPLGLSDARRVELALTTSHPPPPPPTACDPCVARELVDTIVRRIEVGSNYLIVEGGYRSGKSTAVAAAAAVLAGRGHPVMLRPARATDSADVLLRRLLGISRESLLDMLLAHLPVRRRRYISLPRESLLEMLLAHLPVYGRSSDVAAVMLERAPSVPEPVLVVESAERLAVEELRLLLETAKEMADRRLGRMVFVFSPSERLEVAVRGLGALSRATVLPVGDLTPRETAELLARKTAPGGCPADRAAVVHSWLGGRLSDLLAHEEAIAAFCADGHDGGASAHAFEQALMARVGDDATAVDAALRCRPRACSCAALCALHHEAFDEPALAKARGLLLEHRLAAPSLLRRRLVLESTLVLRFMAERCGCAAGANATQSAPPPSGRRARRSWAIEPRLDL
jgi:hypothetical protein